VSSPGLILWLTGLPCSGKSTLAERVAAVLGRTRAVEVLDGDRIRAEIAQELGYSKADRDVNVRRIGFVARLLARHGVLVIAAAISPYAETRAAVRRMAEDEGLSFVEVFVTAGIDVLVGRDVKGLYKRALAGEIGAFSGVSDPYEPPESPDLVVRTDQEPVEQSLARILDVLAARGVATPER
jgi:adenylylsulfate kinase